MEQNGYAVDYGDAYMEQEEEWEREGLLDPAWEKQQKKVIRRQKYSKKIFVLPIILVISVNVVFQIKVNQMNK